MQGLMMNRQLLISSLIEHGAKVYHDREIVSRTVEGPIHRYTFADLHGRSQFWISVDIGTYGGPRGSAPDRSGPVL